MKNDLNLPTGYAALSEEEMTYTEGGAGVAAGVASGLMAVSSAIGLGVLGSSYIWGIRQAREWLKQDGNKNGNFFTVLGRAFDDISADMKQSPSNALRDGVSTAMLITLAPVTAVLLLVR